MPALLKKEKIMKKYIVVLIIFLATCPKALAHSPPRIETEFSPINRVLTVTVIHSVRNPEKHYVDRIELKKDGRRVAIKEFESQDNAKTQTAEFALFGIETDDPITIEANCSITGWLEEQVELEE